MGGGQNKNGMRQHLMIFGGHKYWFVVVSRLSCFRPLCAVASYLAFGQNSPKKEMDSKESQVENITIACNYIGSSWFLLNGWIVFAEWLHLPRATGRTMFNNITWGRIQVPN
jgi:hypothetical protein